MHAHIAGPEFSHAMPEVGSSPQPRPVSAMAGDPPPAEQPKAQGSSGSALQVCNIRN